ncbi:MAG: VOC family protein [Ardenticatenaceae bacterium]|nr:VOC family protein [Ardenticatenaceae bacterium]MCB9446481.1 VOC family protein [Ardenticatenaceae bacterium]
MNLKYEFTRLLVTNFKECFLFYRDVLGFEAGFGSENDTYADFVLGAVNISLFDKQEMSDTLGTTHLPALVNAQDKICLVFAVEDVDTACQQIKECGGQLTAEPTDHPDWGIRTAHLRDPDGNLIEINQPLRS